jgi:hypothetical protein
MEIYKKFELIKLNDKEIDIAKKHAYARTKYIRQQFISKGPTTHEEKNCVGFLGEIAVKKFFKIDLDLEENEDEIIKKYENRKVDKGDLKFKDKVYDVKSENLEEKYYNRLLSGELKDYEMYGCRVFTAKHYHHLPKYTGGLIFCAFKIPNDFKLNKPKSGIRDEYLTNKSVLIIGHLGRDVIFTKKPSINTPPDPDGKSRGRYYSLNFMFHHSELSSVRNILN